MSFQQTGLVLDLRMIFFQLTHLASDLLKNIGNGLRLIAAQPIHERITGLHIQLHGSDTGTILSAIVLLLHEEIQLIQSPQGRTVFLLVMGERFAQADKGQAAFVFDGITHEFRKSNLLPVRINKKPPEGGFNQFFGSNFFSKGQSSAVCGSIFT